MQCIRGLHIKKAVNLINNRLHRTINGNYRHARKKKHKNGRIVKDKDGYEVWEVVGTNTNYHGFGEGDEVSIYIE